MDFSLLSKLLTISGLLLVLSACGENDGGGGGSDSRIVMSTGDTIISLTDLQYQLPVVLQVANIDGSPKANTTVTINLTTVSYIKGFYRHIDEDGEDVNGNGFLDGSEDVNGNGFLDAGEDINGNGFLDRAEDTNNNGILDGDGTTDKWIRVVDLDCAAEDVNRNTALDAGEDTNGNSFLDPDTPNITPHPVLIPTIATGGSTLVTDDNGFGYFTLTYLKTQASWVRVRITATVLNGLAENIGVDEFRLFVLLSDLVPEDDPPAFVVSPYGSTANCTNTI